MFKRLKPNVVILMTLSAIVVSGACVVHAHWPLPDVAWGIVTTLVAGNLGLSAKCFDED